MWWKLLILVVAPYILFALFTYRSYRKLPSYYDLKLIRRVYYLFVVLYISVFILLMHNRIIQLNLFGVKNDQLNYVINVLLLFAIFIIWETVFISCRSFKSIKIKEVEVTLDEREDIKYTDTVQLKQIKDLYRVLSTSKEMKRFIDLYIKQSDLQPDKTYGDIIKEYAKKRKIKTYTFTDDEAGAKQMETELHIDLSQVSAIMYSIDLTGFCIPKELPKMNFSRVTTKYKKNDIIIVLNGDTLIDKENFVLEDIINYFELKIDLEIKTNILKQLIA